MTRNTKATGAITGLKFALACLERGARVAEPFGDYCPYDFVVEVPTEGPSLFFKVQVKSASKLKNGKYLINTQRKVPAPSAAGGPTSLSTPYREGEVDVLISLIEGRFMFFDNVHKLPGTITLKKDDTGKWSKAFDRWDRLKLGAAPLDDPEVGETEAQEE